jgi:hypothetical protein
MIMPNMRMTIVARDMQAPPAVHPTWNEAFVLDRVKRWRTTCQLTVPLDYVFLWSFLSLLFTSGIPISCWWHGVTWLRWALFAWLLAARLTYFLIETFYFYALRVSLVQDFFRLSSEGVGRPLPATGWTYLGKVWDVLSGLFAKADVFLRAAQRSWFGAPAVVAPLPATVVPAQTSRSVSNHAAACWSGTD